MKVADTSTTTTGGRIGAFIKRILPDSAKEPEGTAYFEALAQTRASVAEIEAKCVSLQRERERLESGDALKESDERRLREISVDVEVQRRLLVRQRERLAEILVRFGEEFDRIVCAVREKRNECHELARSIMDSRLSPYFFGEDMGWVDRHNIRVDLALIISRTRLVSAEVDRVNSESVERFSAHGSIEQAEPMLPRYLAELARVERRLEKYRAIQVGSLPIDTEIEPAPLKPQPSALALKLAEDPNYRRPETVRREELSSEYVKLFDRWVRFRLYAKKLCDESETGKPKESPFGPFAGDPERDLADFLSGRGSQLRDRFEGARRGELNEEVIAKAFACPVIKGATDRL